MSRIYLLKERRQIADNTTEIVLSPQEATPFVFLPGQHAELHLIDPKYQDDYGSVRSFSIASAPTEIQLRFAYRNSNSAFKRNVAELPLDSEIEVHGPYGMMTLPDDKNLKVAMIAGGIGITPFHSIVAAAASDNPRPLWLLYANHQESSAPYLAELRQHAASGAMSLIEHFGRIDDAIVKKLVDVSQADLYFLAGPPGLTALSLEALSANGVPRHQIVVEQFTGYE